MSMIALVANGIVAVLLAVTVVYCWRLNRRLSALHAGTDGFKDVIAGLDRATERAQAGLADLRALGSATAGEIKMEREKAAVLLEELKLMIGSADRVANRLAETRPAASPSPAEQRQAGPAQESASGDIYRALRQAR